MKVNPPKPERESIRRRKKKSLDEDFIDISDPSSLYMYDWEQKSKSQSSKKQFKKPDKVVAVKSKPPPEGELDEIMKNENFDKWTFSTQNRQTVSPIRLNLSATTSAPESPQVQAQEPKAEYDSKFDLTDRYNIQFFLASIKC